MGSGQLPKNIVATLAEKMHTTNWPKKILKELLEGANKYDKNPNCAAAGCTIALLFWLVEHVDIAKMEEGKEEEIPRIVRWDVEKTREAIVTVDLQTVEDDKITKDLVMSGLEKIAIGGIEEEDQLSDSEEDEEKGRMVVDKKSSSYAVQKEIEELKRKNEELELKIQRMKKKAKTTEKTTTEEADAGTEEADAGTEKADAGTEALSTSNNKFFDDTSRAATNDFFEEAEASTESNDDFIDETSQNKKNEIMVHDLMSSIGLDKQEAPAVVQQEDVPAAVQEEAVPAAVPQGVKKRTLSLKILIKERTEKEAGDAQTLKEFAQAAKKQKKKEKAAKKDQKEAEAAKKREEEKDKENKKEEAEAAKENEKDEAEAAKENEKEQKDEKEEREKKEKEEAKAAKERKQEKKSEEREKEKEEAEEAKEREKRKNEHDTPNKTVVSKPTQKTVQQNKNSRERRRDRRSAKKAELRAAAQEEKQIVEMVIFDDTKVTKKEGLELTTTGNEREVINVEEQKYEEWYKEKVMTLGKSPFYKIMNVDQKRIINAFYKQAHIVKVAWQDLAFSYAIVTAEMFQEILFRKDIHSDVLDWFGNWLGRTKDENKKHIIFTTLLVNFINTPDEIKSTKKEGIFNHLNKKLEDELKPETHFLIFPFNSGSNHWVVLTFDYQTWEWSFYDSLSWVVDEETKKNPYIEDARRIKPILFEGILTVTQKKGLAVHNDSEIVSKKCPQQSDGNSCAIFATWYMEKVVERNSSDISQIKLKPNEMDKRRIQMLVDILEDAAMLKNTEENWLKDV